jgi:GNAT superfamily N-acetyltransferase
MAFVVRDALIEDLPALAAVELQAATRFESESVVSGLGKRTVPMQEFEAALEARTLWVATNEDRKVVGFLLAERLDNDLHVSEMSVVPSCGRQGIGAALLEAASRHAHETGSLRLSLTTFAAVPWNGPFYAKHGFREMTESEIGEGLAARMRHEETLGLINRVAMCRE